MSETQENVNCKLAVESKFVYNPGYEETGSIIIRLLQKTQIGETSSSSPSSMGDRETSNIQDIYNTPSSDKVSKRLFRLCNEDYADYCVESLLEKLEVPPEFISWLKPQIVSVVVKRAIETTNGGYREFEVIADIELTTIDLILRDSEMEEEEEEELIESIDEDEEECETESCIEIFD